MYLSGISNQQATFILEGNTKGFLTKAEERSEDNNIIGSTSNNAHARKFEKMLNQSQQITEVGIKNKVSTYDTALDFQINAIYSEPAKSAKL